MDVLCPMSSCEGAYRKPNECSRGMYRRVEDPSGTSVLRRPHAHAVPAFLRDVRFLAEREPDGPRLGPGRQCLISGATAEFSQNKIMCEHATICSAKLGGEGCLKLAELHCAFLLSFRVACAGGRRNAPARLREPGHPGSGEPVIGERLISERPGLRRARQRTHRGRCRGSERCLR